MILDKQTMVADNLAYNGSASVIDQIAVMGALGNDTRLFIQGHSLAGVTAFVLLDGPTASPATTRMTIVATAAQLNAGPIEFVAPSLTQRYLTVNLTGASSGTWSCGVVLDNTQTSK